MAISDAKSDQPCHIHHGVIHDCDCLHYCNLHKAAPELLEALKLLERNTQHRNGDCYSNDYMGGCVCGKDKARAAIAKAEGK